VSIPLIQAANLTGAAGIGRAFLGERIGTHCRIAMVIMLVAMCFLIFGPNQSSGEDAAQHLTGKKLLLGGLGALVAGFAYAVHIVLLRKASMSHQIPVTVIAVQVTGIGAVIFGFEFLRDHGYQWAAIWESVPPEIRVRVWGLILLTGFLNMVGFLFQINGVRYTVVARAQMIAVAQIVIGTLFGVFFYRELTNIMIWLGLGLTVLGIYLASTPDKSES
jgi:drug/metabolite transporter (DMT)-like permease